MARFHQTGIYSARHLGDRKEKLYTPRGVQVSFTGRFHEIVVENYGRIQLNMAETWRTTKAERLEAAQGILRMYAVMLCHTSTYQPVTIFRVLRMILYVYQVTIYINILIITNKNSSIHWYLHQ